ncbi:MAG TPA: FAD-binding protein [Pseudonocardiaceae bacterium]|nr:FAD-binding protein [Pseudonocardiaceae bacterium]
MSAPPSTRDYDVICVGGGLGGLAAAALAVRVGARCLVLEATDLLGGVAVYSGGSVWMPLNHLQTADPALSDSPELVDRYLSHLGCAGAEVDEDLRATYFGRGPGIIREYADLGVNFALAEAGDYYAEAPGAQEFGRTLEVSERLAALGPLADRLRRTPYDWGQPAIGPDDPPRADDLLTRGSGLVAAFARRAFGPGGAEVELRARVSRLLVRDGRVGGVQWVRDGRRFTSRGAAVLLATSGYGSAPWAARMEGLVDYAEQAPPVAFGDGLRLAGAVGAEVTRAGNGFFSVGFPSAHEKHPGTDVPLHLPMVASLAFPHCLVVNAGGERFADESFSGTFQSCLREYDDEAKGFRNQPFFFLCDDQYRRNGYRILGLRRDWPDAEFTRADSIGELARRLGIDADRVRRTVARFNELARSGVDTDFGRGKQTFMRAMSDPRYANPMLGELSTPPFWGVRLVPVGAGLCSHGLRIDPQARVLSWSGEPVAGLYATGNAVAYTELPYGYQNGFANGRNIVYAGLAVRHALSSASVGAS